MHLTETEPVHSHAEPDSLAAYGYATVDNRQLLFTLLMQQRFPVTPLRRLCDASTRLDCHACGATIAFADASYDYSGLGAASAISLRRL